MLRADVEEEDRDGPRPLASCLDSLEVRAPHKAWDQSESPAESTSCDSRCPPFPFPKLMAVLSQPQRKGPVVGWGWKEESSLNSNKDPQFALWVRKHHWEGLYPCTLRQRQPPGRGE